MKKPISKELINPDTGDVYQLWHMPDARKLIGGREAKYEVDSLKKNIGLYFEWCYANPIINPKAAVTKDGVIDYSIAKPRAMSLSGLVSFLCISVMTWTNYRRGHQGEEVAEICKRTDEMMKEQKYTGVASDLFNSVIISMETKIRLEIEAKNATTEEAPPTTINFSVNAPVSPPKVTIGKARTE